MPVIDALAAVRVAAPILVPVDREFLASRQIAPDYGIEDLDQDMQT